MPRKKGDGEQGFQDALAEYARSRGWLVAHFLPGQVRPGTFVTNAKYDGKGFPDLVLVRGKRIVFAELKARGIRALRPAQYVWEAALKEVAGESAGTVTHVVWNPADWPTIEVELR